MNTLIVLLGILTTVIAVPAPFPHGKLVTYKYIADAKAGVIEPSLFASNYGIECLLNVQHVTDSISKNTYYVNLTNMKYRLYNGFMKHYESQSVMESIPDLANAILNPFLIVYDENGHLKGVKFMENEPGWSKNMKKGIVSMLQLDMTNIRVQTPIKSHSFITHEDTIHGTCQVAYNVHPLDHVGSNKEFVVTKIHESKNCTRFTYQEMSHFDSEQCHVDEWDDMNTASRRIFVIENQDNEVLIKKLIGHGTINHIPWVAESDTHYLLTNQTLHLKDVVSVSEPHLSDIVRLNPSIIENVIYDESTTSNVPQGDIDVTHGRHTVKLDDFIIKLRKMMNEVAGYLKESQMDKKQSDWKHDQTINRILYVMGFMDVASLEQVYSEIQNDKDANGSVMRNIFLGILSNVGTPAACFFTRNVVRTNSVPKWNAITMLGNLPMHVKVPSKKLLVQMEELLNLDDSVSTEVKEASIFCFATLIRKTFEHEETGTIDPLLDKYLHHFMEHIRNEPTHHMKMVYMMAMKNVRLTQILKFLEPIIRGDEVVSDKPHNIRAQAIWIMKNVVFEHPDYCYNLLWPVLTDVTLPTAVRIAAFDVLMNETPQLGRFINVYWLMVYEKDEHLYNYYVDTLKGLATSVDPCLMQVREMAKKLLNFVQIRNVTGPLSRKFYVDYVDKKYEYNERVKGSLIVDHTSGLPYVGSIEHIASVKARKPVTKLGIHWNIDGLSEIVKDIDENVFGNVVQAIKNDNVKNVLISAAKIMPKIKDVNVNVILTMNNNVVSIFHCTKNNWQKILNELKQWKKLITEYMDVVNWQTVLYHDHYEMHIPTDLGVPAILATKVPSLFSLVGSFEVSEDKNLLILKPKIKYQQWMHGEHTMSIYNPVADVWHSVHRTSSFDVVLPCEMSIGWNWKTKSLKVTWPRLPVSDFSVAGISINGKNYVTVLNDEHDLLKKFCSTCHHHEVVANNVNLKTYENTFDSKDIGTRFKMQYHCDNDFIPVSLMDEWLVGLSESKTIENSMIQAVIAIRHKIMSDVILGQGKSCSLVCKAEPSIVYPTSVIDLIGKVSIQDFHETQKMDLLRSKRIDIRGNLNAKAASTNESIRQWDMNLNILLSQGHVNNSMRIMITRTIPEEKNLKICIEAQNEYPEITDDLLTVNGKKETNTKMTITMGQTKEDKCVRDEMDVTIIMKGEMLEEQKNQMSYDSMYIECYNQSQNPLFHTKSSKVPKTKECIEEDILHSTLRKYTLDMTVRKVPQQIMSTVNIVHDKLRAVFFDHMKHTWNHVQPGNARIVLEFPYLTSVLNLAVTTPTHSYELLQLPFGNPVWNIWMNNIHYSMSILNDYFNEKIKLCTIYPRLLNPTINDAITITWNGVIQFIRSDEWILMSGDHVHHTYSIFVKLVQNKKLALRVYIGEHEMEIMPLETKVSVKIDNKIIDDYQKGIIVSENESRSYPMRLTTAYNYVVIDSQTIPVHIFYKVDSVTVSLHTDLQSQVTGVCGSMDVMHKDEIPVVHSVSYL